MCEPRPISCSNCHNQSLRVLGREDSRHHAVVTSDARLMRDVAVIRTLCNQCACVEIHYQPADRLQKCFREEYDISDEVQSNLIVHDGRDIRKHDYIIDRLFPQLGHLPESGRFLEIACGRGCLARLFQDTHPRWECFGIDPSAKSPRQEKREAGEVVFIQDCFSEHHFKGLTFDVIAAHGFLNRSPVLPEALRMRNLSRKGTLLSLEVLVLDNSVFAPYIWDHPFMYLGDVFDAYLAHAGFTIRSKAGCVSSVHYLCECTSEPGPARGMQVGDKIIDRTARRFDEHRQWWSQTAAAYERQSRACSYGRAALYGAGLFNAVFLTLLARSDFAFVIDDVKSGATFFGLPVIDLEEARQEQGAHVFVCSRPEYAAAMAGKLSRSGIAHSVVSPAEC